MENLETVESSKFQDAIDSYKAKGIETYLIKVDGGKYEFVISEPNLHIQSEYQNAITLAVITGNLNLQPIGAKVIKDCWLVGDQEIRDEKNNPSLFFEACMTAVNTVKISIGSVKKN